MLTVSRTGNYTAPILIATSSICSSQVQVSFHITTTYTYVHTYIRIQCIIQSKAMHIYLTTDSDLPNDMAIITTCDAKTSALSADTLQLAVPIATVHTVYKHVTVYS